MGMLILTTESVVSINIEIQLVLAGKLLVFLD